MSHLRCGSAKRGELLCWGHLSTARTGFLSQTIVYKFCVYAHAKDEMSCEQEAPRFPTTTVSPEWVDSILNDVSTLSSFIFEQTLRDTVTTVTREDLQWYWLPPPRRLDLTLKCPRTG